MIDVLWIGWDTMVYKQQLHSYNIFITSKTIKYAIVYIINFHVHVNRQY